VGLRLEEKFLFENTSWEFLKKYNQKKKFILQYASQKLAYPTQDQINEIDSYEYKVWGAGDTYQKLAYEYYGDPELWWVLAWINKKPTEFHVNSGDVLYVPLVLNEALSLLGIE
tara:strand:+ start:803 stop:1144 length:342 start_codon:yes stop_codon:yes gene_type:complete